MVGALRIGARAGGNVASTLDALADAMRSKLVLEAKIRALTAQGKLQAWVMGLLPFVVLGAMLLIDPTLFDAYFGSVLGWSVIGLVALLQIVGGLLIRHTVNIQI
jgi:tight adherence protein B